MFYNSQVHKQSSTKVYTEHKTSQSQNDGTSFNSE